MINAWDAIACLIFLGGIGVAAVLINRAAKRYGAERIAEGEWDQNGPKHPTAPKRWEEVSPLGYIGLHLDDESPTPANRTASGAHAETSFLIRP